MQSALGEGDREGDDFCANLEDRDKETEVLGGALLMLDIGADFPLGYGQQLSGSFSLWLRAMAPLQRPVIEEELQSAQIISDPLAAEAKVAP